MKYIVISILLELQQYWPLQTSTIDSLVLHVPSTMIHHISNQSLHISAWDRRVFVNYLEGLDTRLSSASSVALNSSHQVLKKGWISSTSFMVNNQINHQESGTANLQKLTSNSGPLLPKPVLWFHLTWLYLIVVTFIILMLSFTLHIFQLNLTLTMLQIRKPLQSNQLMMMKWTIAWNYSNQNIMKIFCMLTSRWFSLDWLSLLLKNFIQSILCCFINMEEQIFQSKI